jgi:EAL domain-containing protein (putative c-di-GMP-specific phosphodiesterase class I)
MVEASGKELKSLHEIHDFTFIYAIRRPQLQSSRFGCYVKDTMKNNNVNMQSTEFTFLRRHGFNKDTYLKECIENIIDMGANVSLQDFGENIFGLDNMHKYDISCLNFSSSLIMSSLKNKNNLLLLETLVLLANRLGQKVVANDIPLQSGIDAMQSIACDCAQGGVVGEDLTIKQLTALLKKSTPPLLASND